MSYRYVKDSFWTDEWVERLDPLEKLLFLYLITNPLCNIAGIYQISTKRIAYETGLDKDLIEKTLFVRLEKEKKIFLWKNYVFIINFIKNQSKNQSVDKGILRILRTIPIELWTDCIQAGYSLPHTLPYLTLLNLTLPTEDISSSEDISSAQEKEKNKEEGEIIDPNRSITTKGSLCDEIGVSGLPKKASTELNERRAKFIKILREAVGVDKFKDKSEWSEASKLETLGKKIGQKEFFGRMKIILQDDFKHKNCNKLSYLRKEIESFIQTKPLTSNPNSKWG